MFSYFTKSKKQKDLFFQLDNELKKTCYDEKISGIYAIFKNDICLYVGQSKNIASRLATHLSGKYKDCSKILIFPTIEPTENLIPLEKFTIQQLKPIENILVDFTEELDKNDFAEGSIIYEIDRCECYDEDFNISNASEIIIVNDSYNILISNEIKIDLYHNNNLIVFLMEQISAVREAKAKI